jgi:hypothetical protein
MNDFNQCFNPVRVEAPKLRATVSRGEVVVDVYPGIRVGYSRQLNAIRVYREDGEILRTEIVPEGYTVSRFCEDCYRFHCLYNNINV